MHYRELLVWGKAMEFAERTFRVTASFPAEQRYVLAAQLQRAALSVPSNIAEGHGRKSTGAFVNHLSIAAGSLLEAETHILLAQRLGYLAEAHASELLGLTSEIGRMLAGLKSSLGAPEA